MNARVAATLVAVVGAAVVGCSRGPAQRTPGGNDVVVSEWVPIVKELQSRGINDAVLLVGALSSYELPLASGQKVWARLPKAFATVASALGRDVAALKTAWVARAASPAAASTLVSELKALAPKLDRLPGVAGTARWDSVEPPQLAIYARTLATQEGIPIPTTSQASAEWLPLLRALRREGYDDPDVLQFVLHRTRLRLKSAAVVEPLDEDARYLTVATALGLDPAKFRQGFFERMMRITPGGPNPVAKAKEARSALAKLPEVAAIDEVPLTLPAPPVKAFREGDELIPPPWEAFSEPPNSLRWRMGAGEDYLDRWLPFWRGLPDSVRRDYLTRHPAPPVWSEWVAGI